VARKHNLSYISIDEQNKKKCLAQAPENGQEAQGTEKSTGQDDKIKRSAPIPQINTGG
jgi:hypothetical protein